MKNWRNIDEINTLHTHFLYLAYILAFIADLNFYFFAIEKDTLPNSHSNWVGEMMRLVRDIELSCLFEPCYLSFVTHWCRPLWKQFQRKLQELTLSWQSVFLSQFLGIFVFCTFWVESIRYKCWIDYITNYRNTYNKYLTNHKFMAIDCGQLVYRTTKN